MSVFALPEERNDALRTDLYQLTMAAGYWSAGMIHRSTFELFNRRLLPDRGFHVACGLELVLRYLEGLSFSGRDIDALRRHPSFAKIRPGFFEYLEEFRFNGEVWAMPEGTPYFPNEPVLRISAPVIEAQIVETYVLAVINFETLIATKAARVVHAAGGKKVIDFGSRRAHGPEAAELAARAAYIAGCSGTSNVEAGTALKMPVHGTYAHSWVMAFSDETEAFRTYHQAFPESTTHLIDTYDTIGGVEKLIQLGIPIGAVRIDSGDLGEVARQVRTVLDGAGYNDTQIVASSDLNEFRIATLEEQKAPIDIYGVGTQLVTSFDCPALGGVYKLVEQEDKNGDVAYRMKKSASKSSVPGAKQVWRRKEQGVICEDIIGLGVERGPEDGEPLLERVMADGVRLGEPAKLKDIRERCLLQVASLAEDVRRIKDPKTVPIRHSRALVDLVERVGRST